MQKADLGVPAKVGSDQSTFLSIALYSKGHVTRVSTETKWVATGRLHWPSNLPNVAMSIWSGRAACGGPSAVKSNNEHEEETHKFRFYFDNQSRKFGVVPHTLMEQLQLTIAIDDRSW